MEKKINHRGFQIIEFEDKNGEPCSLQQSSAIDDEKEDAFSRPGSSYVWLGQGDDRMHLDPDTIKELIKHLNYWLKHGYFE